MNQIETYTETEVGGETDEMAALGLHPKLMQVLQSRKVWAGLMGLGSTLGLWWLGEIDGARAVEALTWVLGIFIGSVALEDGMTHLFGTLAHAVATPDVLEQRESRAKNQPLNEGANALDRRGEHEESAW
jgi:hypothetical protein